LTPTQEKIAALYRSYLKEKYKRRLKEEFIKAGVVPRRTDIAS
jgi:hypothetical protein